jgi:hypothetical protein
VRVRRPELQAQLFTCHDFAGLLKQREERLINFALQLDARAVLEKFFFFQVQMKRAEADVSRGNDCSVI